MTRIAAATRRPSACSAPSTSIEQRPVERLAGAHAKLGAGPDPEPVEVAQHLGVGVGDPREVAALPRLELGERDALLARYRRARGRGSGRRAGRDSGRRARPPSAPRAPRRCSARAPRPRRGRGPRASRAPRRGRPRSAGGGGSPRARPARPPRSARRRGRAVLDQAQLGHPLQHRGHGPGRDAEPLGQRRGPDRAVLAARERVDRLRVVLDRLGVGRRRAGAGCAPSLSYAHQQPGEVEERRAGRDRRPPSRRRARGPRRRASRARSGRSPGRSRRRRRRAGRRESSALETAAPISAPRIAGRAGDQPEQDQAAERRPLAWSSGATIARPSVVLWIAKPTTRKAPSASSPIA